MGIDTDQGRGLAQLQIKDVPDPGKIYRTNKVSHTNNEEPNPQKPSKPFTLSTAVKLKGPSLTLTIGDSQVCTIHAKFH